jgi:hypothetical protein
MMRFTPDTSLNEALTDAAAKLLGIERPASNECGVVTDRLIAWNIPAPPGYLPAKRAIFTSVLPGWEKIFVEGSIDWRHVSWGGVLIDGRAYNTTDEPCNCIPAADNPRVSNVAEATWLKDSDIIFGIEVNGEARAYPRRIMEVREMVNDTLGGRALAIPYCTLCGAAQAYFTDQLRKASSGRACGHPVFSSVQTRSCMTLKRTPYLILSRAMLSQARFMRKGCNSSRHRSSQPIGDH